MSELAAAFLGAIVGGLFAALGGAWVDRRRRDVELRSRLVFDLLPALDRATDALWEEVFANGRIFYSREFYEVGQASIMAATALRHRRWAEQLDQVVGDVYRSMPSPLDQVDSAGRAENDKLGAVWEVIRAYREDLRGQLGRRW